MSRSIWKFVLPVKDGDIIINMPEHAILMEAREQHGKVCVWAVVKPAHPMVPHRFRIYGTGPFPEDMRHADFLGAAHLLDGRLVWHVFDLGEVTS